MITFTLSKYTYASLSNDVDMYLFSTLCCILLKNYLWPFSCSEVSGLSSIPTSVNFPGPLLKKSFRVRLLNQPNQFCLEHVREQLIKQIKLQIWAKWIVKRMLWHIKAMMVWQCHNWIVGARTVNQNLKAFFVFHEK